MQRAIQLAKFGEGYVAPNPMVGCVIVHNNLIIGEGWHKAYGQPHAEVNAINNVADKSLLPNATVFVTLEPCCHFGKTPPCANLLVSAGVKHVVVGMQDPNPIVSGKGITFLKNNGVLVETNILQQACEELNARFITYQTQNRPYIILKWAQSADGFIAPEKKQLNEDDYYSKKQLSGELAQMQTHQWRAAEAAVMVGANTALYDNPQLNVRHWQGKNPTRVLLDLNQRVPLTHHIFDGSQPTIVFTAQKNEVQIPLVTFIQINLRQPLLKQILDVLYQHQIQSLIVEGGSKLQQTFLDVGCWDLAQVIATSKQLNTGVLAPKIDGKIQSKYYLGNDLFTIYKPS